MIKRIFDIVLSVLLIVILFFPYLLIYIAVFLTSGKPVIFWSDRVGRNNELFKMPKFRTMHTDTPLVATHLLPSNIGYGRIGLFLRRSSLDELPQLWCILIGRMTFVGPRPALYNQLDLIKLRTDKGVHTLLPGLTGLAQINGRDELNIKSKVRFDSLYLRKKSFLFDVRIIFITFIKVTMRKNISV
jgi:O-antigen biosynthesis protein WbqP